MPPAESRLTTGATAPSPWDGVAARLRASGLRWTPQRRTLVDVLREHRGHVTATELISRCRERDGTTTPSTVYRTLDVLEEFGLIKHGHGPDGREEYHVLPGAEHAHLRCLGCGVAYEIERDEAQELVGRLGAARGFTVVLSHVMIGGYCPGCEPLEA